MAKKIKVNIAGAAFTGKIVTFKAPCDCTEATGLVIGEDTYDVVDALGNCITGSYLAWSGGAVVSVALDVDSKKAFLQNEKPTPAAIGAAPAGHGSEGEAMTYYSGQKQDDSEILAILNGELTKLSNYSSSKFGMYVYPAMAIDLLMCEMIKINAITAMVKAYSYNGWKLQRMFASGVWGAWEWVNPPMNLGVEYRTTERYLGKPVYVKAVNIGNLPASTHKSVEHGVSDVDKMFPPYGQTSEHWSIPTHAYGFNTMVSLSANRTSIAVLTATDRSGTTATVVLKYTKTTD